jgi:hypothetical protein
MKSKVHVEDDHDFGFIVIAAVRYVTGRQSYGPGLVQDFVKRNWSFIDLNTRNVMIKDLREELKRAEEGAYLLGADFDHAGWVRFKDWMVENKE